MLIRKKQTLKVLQVGPFPPPLGGWSFHIRVFKEYLDSISIPNQVLDIGENRKMEGRGCIPVRSSFDLVKEVVRYSLLGYRVYVHLNGNSIKGLLLTLLVQIVTLLTLRRALISFHAGVEQVCFTKAASVHRVLAYMVFWLAMGTICNSEAVRDKICKYFPVKPSRIFPIPCFSIQYIRHEEVLQDNEKAFLEAHSPVVCSYLFFRPEYDPDILLKALQPICGHFPDFGLIIIGDKKGCDEYIGRLPASLVDRHCLLTGEKSHDNFLSIVEKCDLMIRTPISDGVCSSVMEALALKVPVIATDNGTRPEEVILFDPGDPGALADRVIVTLQNIDMVKAGLSGTVQRDAIAEEYNFLAGHLC